LLLLYFPIVSFPFLLPLWHVSYHLWPERLYFGTAYQTARVLKEQFLPLQPLMQCPRCDTINSLIWTKMSRKAAKSIAPTLLAMSSARHPDPALQTCPDDQNLARPCR
jgi:hypothetical protein